MTERITLDEAMDQVKLAREILSVYKNISSMSPSGIEVALNNPILNKDISYQIISQRIAKEMKKNPTSKDYEALANLHSYFSEKLYIERLKIKVEKIDLNEKIPDIFKLTSEQVLELKEKRRLRRKE